MISDFPGNKIKGDYMAGRIVPGVQKPSPAIEGMGNGYLQFCWKREVMQEENRGRLY